MGLSSIFDRKLLKIEMLFLYAGCSDSSGKVNRKEPMNTCVYTHRVEGWIACKISPALDEYFRVCLWIYIRDWLRQALECGLIVFQQSRYSTKKGTIRSKELSCRRPYAHERYSSAEGTSVSSSLILPVVIHEKKEAIIWGRSNHLRVQYITNLQERVTLRGVKR